jgi:hypothetical protein
MKNLFLFFFFATTVSAQVPSISWIAQDSTKEYMNGGTETSDGSYITVGATNLNKLVVKKTWCDGQVSWTKQYGTMRHWGVRETIDHNYIIVGDTGSDARLTKMDTSGNIIWERGYIYPSANEHGYGVDLTPDSGYIVLTNYVQVGCRIIKTDSLGLMQWDTLYPNLDNAMAIVTSANHTYTLLSAQDFPNDSLFLTQLDSVGGILWRKSFIGQDGPSWSANSLIRTTDGGFAFVAKDLGQGCLFKTDSSGNLQWKKFLYPGNAYSMAQTPDGGYLVTGTNWGTYMMKTDAAGDSLWTFRQSPTYVVSQVGFPTADSGYFYAACCDSIFNTDFSIKFNNGGTPCVITTGKSEHTIPPASSVFPNPVFAKAIIRVATEGRYTFILTDLPGREAFRISFTGQVTEFNSDNLPAGLYVYRIQNEKGIVSVGKVVVE